MIHSDEAKKNAIESLKIITESDQRIQKAVLIHDIFGKLRLVVWSDNPSSVFTQILSESIGTPNCAAQFWSGEVWSTHEASKADREVYDDAWDKAADVGSDRIRILERRRGRGFWFAPSIEPPWEAPELIGSEYPPIVLFYSFKGGVGRSTAIAAIAMQLAAEGQRIVVVDADLDAPGVGTLLAPDGEESIARWGVTDYLLERPVGPVDIRDYYHACRQEKIAGKGEILVVPAGRIDSEYLNKLSRLDFEPLSTSTETHPMASLLQELRSHLKPRWILMDVRAGLSEPTGMLLSGFGHLHVLFGTSSQQSWHGLRLIIDRLGAERIRSGKPQMDCLLVQAMVPPAVELSQNAIGAFADQARDEFSQHYFSAEEGENVWSMADIESSDGPHVPIPISYDQKLGHFSGLSDVSELLLNSDDYRRLTVRITARFGGQEK